MLDITCEVLFDALPLICVDNLGLEAYIENTFMRATELFLQGPVHSSSKKSSPSYQQNYDALLDSNLFDILINRFKGFRGWSKTRISCPQTKT